MSMTSTSASAVGGSSTSTNSTTVPVATSATIRQLETECRRATKRTKTSTAALQQHVDNLMHLVDRFLAEHDADDLQGEGAPGGLFMRRQLPQFASELKRLVEAVTATFKDLHSQTVAPLGKSVDRSFVSNQEAYFDHYLQTNGLQRSGGEGERLFDEDVVRLVVMQHLVREGHFDAVDMLEEEMMSMAEEGSGMEKEDADGDQLMNGSSTLAGTSSSDQQRHRVSEPYKRIFREMYDILNDMKEHRQLDKALAWCKNKKQSLTDQELRTQSNGGASFIRGDLHGNVSHTSKLTNLNSLEFMLHKLRFIELLRVCSDEHASDQCRSESMRKAIAYSRLHFSHFSDQHMEEIRFLMGSLLYAKKIQNSPYRSLFDSSHWDRAIDTFKMECCAQEGQAVEAPLYVALTAGSQALPTILKMLNVTKNRFLGQTNNTSVLDMNLDDSEDDDGDDDDEEENDDDFIFGETGRRTRKQPKQRQMGQLGVHVDLDPSFTFHSVFACPVSKELTNDEDNPPMMLPCGHVLAKNSISKMIRPPRSMFKCPYCPTEASMTTCKKIHF